ncbi:hypothetical protein HG530_004547 [Fusarium avenaceum]|nr:hypothetical protein HG530_004547 [Fusarium avenaceum]
MCEENPVLLERDIGLGLSFVCRTGDGSRNNVVLLVCFDNYTILAQLLLDENDLLRTTNNEVTTRIKRTFVHLLHFCVVGSSKATFGTLEHDWHAPQGHVLSYNPLLVSDVLDIDENGRGPEIAVHFASNGSVGAYDILDLLLDEEVI